MRMLQSVSGHSSKQSIAHYSSRPTLSQLKGVSHTISNWFENHQPQRTQISTVTNAPFIQNSNRMAFSWPQPQVFRASFFNSSNIQDNVQAFWLTGLLWWQKLTWLFQFFIPREATLESSLTVVWFSYRLMCHFFVLTTFWRHLWSITEQTHGNMESICFI